MRSKKKSGYREEVLGGRLEAGLKKNQEITVEITDFTREGEGIGKWNGFPLFIKDTVIGDEVVAAVTRVKKNYGYARLLALVRPSADRVIPRCPSARQCGGCRLQQLSYEKQLEFKRRQVVNCLSRIGGFENAEDLIEEVCGMENPWHYRNKAQYPVGYDREGRLVAGFYAGRTHFIIPNTDCVIQAEGNRDILKIILDHMEEYRLSAYDEAAGTGLVRHIYTRIGKATGQVMVCLVINGAVKEIRGLSELVDKLSGLEGMASIIININKERTNRILGQVCKTVWGKDYIEDEIEGVRYRIGPLSFYQVNPMQTKVLYGKALEYAALSGNENVWDLYCGIGTISLFLAKKAGHVYGVEIVEEAVRYARENAMINGMDNVDFFCGKAEEVVPAFYEKTGIRPDVVVVDPPRKGCDPALLATILSARPDRVVYVSCDPGTLARDLKILCQEEYELKKVMITDQFCHSTHVETVVLMSRVEK